MCAYVFCCVWGVSSAAFSGARIAVFQVSSACSQVRYEPDRSARRAAAGPVASVAGQAAITLLRRGPLHCSQPAGGKARVRPSPVHRWVVLRVAYLDCDCLSFCIPAFSCGIRSDGFHVAWLSDALGIVFC